MRTTTVTCDRYGAIEADVATIAEQGILKDAHGQAGLCGRYTQELLDRLQRRPSSRMALDVATSTD